MLVFKCHVYKNFMKFSLLRTLKQSYSPIILHYKTILTAAERHLSILSFLKVFRKLRKSQEHG